MITANIILETPKVLVAWDNDCRCVVISWKGPFVSGDEYRSILMRVLDLLEEKRASRLLSDSRNMPVMSPDDQKWLQDVWMPRSIKVGLRYSAVVAPKSALTKSTLRHIIDDSGDVPRQRAFFPTVEEAKAWLKSIPGAS